MVRSRAAALLTGGVVMVAVVATAWFSLAPKSDIEIERLLLDDMPAPPSVAEDKWVVKLTEENDGAGLAIGRVRKVWSTAGDTEGVNGVVQLSVYEHRNSWLAGRYLSELLERSENNFDREIEPPDRRFDVSAVDEFELGCFSSGPPCEVWTYLARYGRYVVALDYASSPIDGEDFEVLVLETDEHIGETLSD